MERVAAIILAGGGSTRMGREKATIRVRGRSLLQWVADAAAEVAETTVVVLAPGGERPALEVRGRLIWATDAVSGQGPLAGILAGVACAEEAGATVALVLACDQPFVRPALLRRLLAALEEGVPAVTPIVEGRPQPLCAAVRIETAKALRAAFAAGGRAASAIVDLAEAVTLDPVAWHDADPEGLSFLGANTPEELARCEQAAARLG
jgi:molybdopterin-guanine dinucleotide biosynthesis protein A